MISWLVLLDGDITFRSGVVFGAHAFKASDGRSQ